MLALIPARGGSKQLPGKNVRLLCGEPLIAHTIQSARRAHRISRVVVSTDSKEIAEVAKKYGAEVPFMRPRRLATDQALALDTYLYTVERLNRSLPKNERIAEIAVLLPTAPLRTAEDIDAAVALFETHRADSVISYTRQEHPLEWCKYIGKDDRIEDIFRTRPANRQAFRPVYRPNGAIYVFRAALLYKGQYRSSRSFAYIMPRERSVDIDDEADFLYAEFLMKRRGRSI